ncbi:MAG: flagellar filament capping protein FliD [Gemmatimonadota bacterium]
MASIGSFSGIASGIQWRDMVDQMMQVEANRRISPVQTQVGTAQKRRDAWNNFSSLLSKFRTSAQALQDGSSFDTLKASVSESPTSGKALFTATPSATASPGSYQVEVVNLARADKLSGGVFAATGDALGIEGDFFVNGQRVDVVAGDTLASLRDKINAENSGSEPTRVTATILSTSADEHRLVLTSGTTGTRGLELVDGDDGALESLGITTGAFAQNTDPDDAGNTQSQRFSSTTTPLASMLGVTAPPAVTTIDIDGQKVTVDLENDTMLELMNRIAAAGGSASLDQETVSGTAMNRLTVAGSVTADVDAGDPAASQRVVELLGFQTGVRASSITTGEDASVKIDGFELTRRSNVVSDAIEGVTLNLQSAEEGTDTELVVTRDLGAVVKAAESMASAYNELVKFADVQAAPGQPLASNASFRATMTSLSRTLLSGVEGLEESNPYTHASIAGIELTKEGHLEVDSTKLKSALETNLSDVRSLLTSSGSTTDAEVSYILGGSEAKPGGYEIDITAAATQATTIGAAWADVNAYAAGDGVSDTLTLTDSFSGKTVDYVIADGDGLATTVSSLNAAFEAEGLRVTATEEGGALRISASEYGASNTFTVSGAAAGQLGLVEDTFAGTDVEGTIGGLAATGKGRTLTGADGGDTEGIAIRYTGTTARTAGEVRYVLGVGGMFDQLVEPAIRESDGTIASQVGALDRSINTMNSRLDDIEARLEVRREALISQFTRMEAALSQLQSQGNWLTAQIQSLGGGQ